jgi:hypothetical protein
MRFKAFAQLLRNTGLGHWECFDQLISDGQQRRFRLIASNALSQPDKDRAPPQNEIQTIYDERRLLHRLLHLAAAMVWLP